MLPVFLRDICQHQFDIGRDKAYYVRQSLINDMVIHRLVKLDFNVRHVFCTFETEHCQRACLTALKTGVVQSMCDTGDSLPKEYKMDSNVLMVVEAPEPSDVIWQNLGQASFTKRMRNKFSMIVITMLAVIVTLVLYLTAQRYLGAAAGVIFITIANYLVPMSFPYLTELEHNTLWTGYQRRYHAVAVQQSVQQCSSVAVAFTQQCSSRIYSRHPSAAC
jgi:hypothetical protein